MSEQPIARRRNRLTHHYTITSNVLIFGYRELDDGAKLTYQAIDSFDWPDQVGERKGYAYPSVPTLAKLRGISERTIQRHVDALEAAGLLKREFQAGRPCLLWIEEPSAEESEQYLSTIAERGVTEMSPPVVTRMSPHKKDESEKFKHVNESQRLGEQKRTQRLTALERAKREWLANHMVNELGDPHSLGFYRKVAETVPEHRIFEALGEVRIAAREQRVRTSPGAVFAFFVNRDAS